MKARQAAQRRAYCVIFGLLEAGVLPPAENFPCADCGATARLYDHRDYDKPLSVDPVCRACNYKRGPAMWSGATRSVNPTFL